MNLLKKVKNIIMGEAHSFLDKIEDKIKTFELKIIEAKENQQRAMSALASLKTEESLMESRISKKEKEMQDYMNKAQSLKARYESAENKEEMASLIKTMLSKHSSAKNELDALIVAEQKQEAIRKDTEQKIKRLNTMIQKYESQVSTLKAQRQAAKANKAVAKELSSFNVDGMDSEFQKLTQEVERDVAEADAWTNLGDGLKSDDQRIEELLSKTSEDDDFDAFMKS